MVIAVTENGGLTMWICEKGGHCVDSCEGCEHYVEMVEVKHGRWEVNELGYLCCTACGWVRYGIPLVEHYQYCPHCGADMREVDHADHNN